jgi:hypothetical protein
MDAVGGGPVIHHLTEKINKGQDFQTNPIST